MYPDVPTHSIRQRMLAAIRRPRAPLVPPAWRNSVIIAMHDSDAAEPKPPAAAVLMPAINPVPQLQSERNSSISVQTECDQ
jgi:hypothetical protein